MSQQKQHKRERIYFGLYFQRNTIHHGGEKTTLDREGMVPGQEAGWPHCTHTQEVGHA